MEKTEKYALNLYEANDLPNLLDGYNGSMNIIDENMQRIDDAATNALSEAANAQTTANSASASVTELEHIVTDHETLINNNTKNISELKTNVNYGKNNPIFYGADPTGTNDSAEAINQCIEACKGNSIIFSPGTYIIKSPILTPFNTNNRVSIDFNGATIIADGNTAFNMLKIGFSDNPTDTDFTNGSSDTHSYFMNGTLKTNISDFVIEINEHYKQTYLINLTVSTARNFAKLGTTGKNPSDTQLSHSFIRCTNPGGNFILFDCYGTDNKCMFNRIYGFGTYWNNGVSTYSYCNHYLGYAVVNASVFKNGSAYSIGDYFDSIQIVFNSCYGSITNAFVYSYFTTTTTMLFEHTSTLEPVVIDNINVNTSNISEFKTLDLLGSQTINAFNEIKISNINYISSDGSKIPSCQWISTTIANKPYSPPSNTYGLYGYILLGDYDFGILNIRSSDINVNMTLTTITVKDTPTASFTGTKGALTHVGLNLIGTYGNNRLYGVYIKTSNVRDINLSKVTNFKIEYTSLMEAYPIKIAAKTTTEVDVEFTVEV